MKRKIYIVTDSTDIGDIIYSYMDYNSFTSIKKAKRSIKKLENYFYNKVKIYKVNIKEIK